MDFEEVVVPVEAEWDNLDSSDEEVDKGDFGEDFEKVADDDGDVVRMKEDEEGLVEGEGEVKPLGKYRFHGAFMFVTYSQSKVNDHWEFYERLRARMPEGTMIYGGQEKHKDGNPHYHVVIRFPKRVHWSDARSHLVLEDDTGAVKIRGLERGQSRESFLEGTQAYCEKDENPFMFGKRIELDSGREGDRKRKYREVDEEEDYETAKRKLREFDPYRFIFSYGNVVLYLDSEKKRKVCARDGWIGHRSWFRKWKVPSVMEKWRMENVENRGPGRASSLVLVGKGKTGKTSWAKSFGTPMVMSKRWNLKNYGVGCSHIVVNDVKPGAFGPSGDSYWREVLGCQESFDATDRYCGTVRLDWNIPCIWTCNWDQDPRRSEEIRSYMEDVGVVVVEVDEPLFESGDI